MAKRSLPSFAYPRAGARGDSDLAAAFTELLVYMLRAGVPIQILGPSMVLGFAEFFRSLPDTGPGLDKTQVPLLYELLGSGTPPLKMAAVDAAYQDRPVGKQRCENCSSAYKHVVSGDFICSQIDSLIEPNGYCRLWNHERL